MSYQIEKRLPDKIYISLFKFKFGLKGVEIAIRRDEKKDLRLKPDGNQKQSLKESENGII